MGAQKKCPQKTKSWIVDISLFVSEKEVKLPPQQQKWKDDFQFLTFPSTKLQNTLAQNSLDKLMQLTSMEPDTYDLDRVEITDLHKFLKKTHSLVLRWCNLTINI